VSVDPNEPPTLQKWLPSPLSKGLAATVPSVGAGTFFLARANTDWFGIENLEPIQQTVAALLISLVPMLGASWLLLAELIYIVNSKRHRIITTNYAQPHARWGLLFFAVLMFGLGYAAHP
jgi:hypothetical protein